MITSLATAPSASTSDPALYATSYSTDGEHDDNDNDDVEMPWEQEGWVPRTKSGKQKTPNVIRNELQRYIDECKANNTSNQTAIIAEMSVNNNSFRRFMNPKTYKGAWSAVQNGTYWAAARLLERVKHEKEEAKKAAKTSAKRKKLDGIGDTTTSTSASGKKVKASTSTVATKPKSKSKAALKAEATDLVERINAVVNVNVDGESNSNSNVYDSCPQVVTKMKAFLQRDGMTKSLLLSALGNINNNSLNRFMASKKQDQCGNIAYRAGYVFFEKLRILEGKPKSSARIKNEANNPEGFSIVKERAGLWVKHLPLAPWE